MAESPINPGEVAIRSPTGQLVAVPKEQAAKAQEMGGKVLSPQDMNEVLHGGVGDMWKAFGLGAAETATQGGSTALLAEGGVLAGGQTGRKSVEDEIRAIEKTNPIAHTLGEVAPLLLVPEAGGEELAASLVGRGEGLAARAGRFALPEFARGAAETAAIEQGKGISEDILDHDLAAESFYIHSMKPETLYGGLLNVGVSGAFKGFGKLTSSLGRQAAGRAGEVAAADAKSIEETIRAVQMGGGTSEEASAAIRDMQGMAERRAILPTAEKRTMDKAVEPFIQAHAKGDPNVARQYRRIYLEGSKVTENLDNEMTTLARQADTHIASMTNDLAVAQRAQFGLKYKNVRELAEASSMPAAADAANKFLDELDAIANPIVAPPPAKTAAMYERELLGALKRPKGTRQIPLSEIEERTPWSVDKTARIRKGMDEGAKLPPVSLSPMEDGSYAINDGIHRVAEARARGLTSIEAKTSAAETVTDAMRARIRATAESLAEREAQTRMAEVARLQAERLNRIDPVIRETIAADPVLAVGIANKDLTALQNVLGNMRKEIRAAIREGGQEGVARIHTALDAGKRIIGGNKVFSDNAAMGKALRRWVYENRLQPMLEDSNIWGTRLADMQATTNKAFSDNNDAVMALRQRFTGKFGHDKGMPIYVNTTPSKGFLEKLGTYENGFDEEVVTKAIDAARVRGQAMQKTMDLPPQVVAAIQRAGESANKLEATLTQARQIAEDARSIKALRAREGSSPIGGITGKLVELAVAPGRSLEFLGHFRKAEGAVRDFVSKESSSFVKGGPPPAAPFKRTLSAGEREAAQKTIQDLQKYQTDPRNLALELKTMLGDMPSASPVMASAVAQVVARGVLALAKRAPQPLPPRLNDKPGEVRYASGELEKFWREKQLVEQPKVIAQMMRSGDLRQEDMNLAKEVIPRIIAQMQMQLERDILDARKKGALRTMSYQEQLNLSWMLGRPVDASQEPGFISAMQSSAANDPMNQAALGMSAMGGGRPSSSSKSVTEPYETLETRLSK